MTKNGRRVSEVTNDSQFIFNELTNSINQAAPYYNKARDNINIEKRRYKGQIDGIRNNSTEAWKRYNERKQYLQTLYDSSKWDQIAQTKFYTDYFKPIAHDWKAVLLFDGWDENNFWIQDDEKWRPTVYKYDYKTKAITSYPGEYNAALVQQKAWAKQLIDKLKEEKIPYFMDVFHSYYYDPIKFK